VAQNRPVTIGELVELTGVPASTIHYYRRTGLLPAIRVAPNRYAYDESHVQALKLIRLLRERRRVPLGAIARLVPELLQGGEEEAFRTEAWDVALAGEVRPGAEAERRVLDAAIELFLRRGYAEVSIDDIAEEAGVAKGSVYRYFPSKEEVFFAAVESAVGDAVHRFETLVGSHGRAVDVDTAAKLLVGLLNPLMPVLFELGARSLQGRPGHPAVARRVLETLVSGIGACVSGPLSERERGAAALQAVMVDGFRAVLPPPE
jgi:AcrR family transcriptional regulator